MGEARVDSDLEALKAGDEAAFQSLIHRINTGHWGSTSPAPMNASAAGLGPGFNFIVAGSPPHVIPTAPAFLRFSPARFLRPFDARNLED